MASSRRTSDASNRTRGSIPAFRLYPPAMSNDSKAQNVLGLSQPELHSARDQSARSVSTPQPDQISFHQFFARGKARSGMPAAKVFSSPTGYLDRKNSIDKDSDVANLAQAVNLRRQSSNSTIRSFYDAAKAPLRISQQTSDSASQEFAYRQVNPIVKSSESQDMGQSRALRFFKSSRLRNLTDSRQSRKYAVQEMGSPPISLQSRTSISSGKSPLTTNMSNFSSPITPMSPQSIHSNTESTRGVPPKIGNPHSTEPKYASVSKPILPTPYAKVNVRRPKAGTTNWFDNLDEDSSEDEVQVEAKKASGVRVESKESTEQKHDSGYDFAEATDHSRESAIVHDMQQSSRFAQIDRPKAPVVLDSEIYTLVTARSEEFGTSSKFSKHKLTPPDRLDLTRETASQMAETQDVHGEENDILPPLQTLPSPGFVPTIRESIALDAYGDVDLEIGLAQAVKAAGNLQRKYPTPIKLTKARGIEGTSSAPSKISTAATLYKPSHNDPIVAQYEYNESITKDPDEDALLSSFPATPTDTVRGRRTSWRSSMSFSDDKSVRSMRVMKVTRQEEKLIAAMRMKKAAMQEAAETTVRKEILDPSELNDQYHIRTNRSSMTDHITQWNEFAISQLAHSPRYSGLGIHHDNHERLPSYIGINAPAELDGTASPQDDLQPKTPADIEAQNHLKTPTNRQLLSKSRGLFPHRTHETDSRPQSFLSTTTEDSQKCNSNLIVLENLNSGLPMQTLPSQLLMESPFTTWENNGSATAH